MESDTSARTRAHFLEHLALRIAGLRGWRAWSAAFLFGICATAALPPHHIIPLLLVAFTGLLWLVDGATRLRSVVAIGWWFGFGHFLAGLYWVGYAFLVDSERFAAFLPIAVAGLSAGMALYPALVVAITWRCGVTGCRRIVVLAVCWLLGEWLRSWLFTGFPWNQIGSAWSFSTPMIQSASVAGIWGLSLVTVMAAAAPASLAGTNAASRRGGLVYLSAITVGLAALWVSGSIRLDNAPEVSARLVPGVVLRIVAPPVDQTTKWQTETREQHVLRQIQLSRSKASQTPTHVVWPETAVPFVLNEQPAVRLALSQAVPDGGLLITGALRSETGADGIELWNSLFAVDDNGNIAEHFDKVHLVPFGEYVPFRRWLNLAKLTEGRIDFSSGKGLRTLRLPGLPPVGPLICYEIIFPGRVTNHDDRPQWLLNITNDAWFGKSAGPHQHFAAARLRAVEEGLAVVRAANAGISAVIGPYGQVVANQAFDDATAFDSPLPLPIEGITFYAQNRSVPVWICLALLAIFFCPIRSWGRMNR